MCFEHVLCAYHSWGKQDLVLGLVVLLGVRGRVRVRVKVMIKAMLCLSCCVNALHTKVCIVLIVNPYELPGPWMTSFSIVLRWINSLMFTIWTRRHL